MAVAKIECWVKTKNVVRIKFVVLFFFGGGGHVSRAYFVNQACKYVKANAYSYF